MEFNTNNIFAFGLAKKLGYHCEPSKADMLHGSMCDLQKWLMDEHKVYVFPCTLTKNQDGEPEWIFSICRDAGVQYVCRLYNPPNSHDYSAALTDALIEALLEHRKEVSNGTNAN